MLRDETGPGYLTKKHELELRWAIHNGLTPPNFPYPGSRGTVMSALSLLRHFLETPSPAAMHICSFQEARSLRLHSKGLEACVDSPAPLSQVGRYVEQAIWILGNPGIAEDYRALVDGHIHRPYEA